MRVAIISMPFCSVKRPSIQLGILKALIQKNANIQADDYYLGIDLAVNIGLDTYESISGQCDILLGEWFFSDQIDWDNEYLEYNKKRLKSIGLGSQDQLRSLKNYINTAWISSIFQQISWQNYDFVFFSSTYSQINGSLLLAKMIKQTFSDAKIVFGGSSFTADMGEEIFSRELVIDILVQGEVEGIIDQVLSKDFPTRRILKAGKKVDLNTVPVPDYTSYFNKIGILNNKKFSKVIPFESSRGCWWGKLHHCTFCGLNGEVLDYNQKSVSTIMKEIEVQSKKYQLMNFECTDNIMPRNFFSTILTSLGKYDYNFFYEVKSNMSKKEVCLLKEAGVRKIQPGIESLSTSILELMNKGVKASKNIQTLLFCMEYGIEVSWNMLYGFPEEDDASYSAMTKIIPHLYHLPPPNSVAKIRVDRFSPLFIKYQDCKFLSFSKNYTFCFPSNWNLKNLAYFFEGNFKTNVNENTYVKFLNIIIFWQKLHAGDTVPKLEVKRGINFLQIMDTRNSQHKMYKLTDELCEIYELLKDGARSESYINENSTFSEDQVSAALSKLEGIGLVLHIDKLYIWLPLPV